MKLKQRADMTVSMLSSLGGFEKLKELLSNINILAKTTDYFDAYLK